MFKIFENSILYILAFASIMAIFRIIPHPPNFTPILAIAVTGPLLLKSKIYGLSIPILAMFLSDLILGFHSFQIVIYLTLIVISILSPMKKNYLKFFFMSVFASLLFFIITNLAVWLIWDYYPKNISGLLICYTMAIPFFQNTLISTILFTFIFTYIAENIYQLNKDIKVTFTNLIRK